MICNALNDHPVTYRDVFRNSNWSRLWIGQTISQLGDAMALTAFPLLVYQVTDRSVSSLGASLAVQWLPLVIIGPIAGSLVDRWNRRSLLFTIDVVRTLCALGIFFSSSLWQLYTLALAASIMQAVFLPTYSAIIPDLTGNQYVKAISLSYTGYRLMQVIGPAIVGCLIAVVTGPRPLFLLDAATFFVAGIMTLTVYVKPCLNRSKMQNILNDLHEALTFIRTQPIL